MLARFNAITAHTHAGDTVSVTEVSNAWDALERHGHINPSWAAASATAIWLAGRNHRDLALGYLRWAAHLGHHNALVFYADALSHFDLPTDPDGPHEQLESLLDQLDFV